MTNPASAPAEDQLSEPAEDDLVEDELLVEEISIDGMCGVY
jgi:mycofactocin precursor